VDAPTHRIDLWLQFATYGCDFIRCNWFRTSNGKSIYIMRSNGNVVYDSIYTVVLVHIQYGSMYNAYKPDSLIIINVLE